jgi:hypothetical protein
MARRKRPLWLLYNSGVAERDEGRDDRGTDTRGRRPSVGSMKYYGGFRGLQGEFAGGVEASSFVDDVESIGKISSIGVGR